MKAIGQFAEGIAAHDAGKYSRKVMEVNAQTAQRDGAAEASRLRDVARLAMGRQAAGLAASGFTLSGSALDALRESATESELEIMQTRRKAEAASRGYKQQGALAYAEGYSRMVGGIVSGAASIAETAANFGGGGG